MNRGLKRNRLARWDKVPSLVAGVSPMNRGLKQ